MEYFDDLLSGRDTAQDGLAQRLFFDSSDESFRDLKINIGFEQCQADLAQRVIDVRFANCAMTPQVLEDLLQFVAELGKHRLITVDVVPRNLGSTGSLPKSCSWQAPWLSQ